MRKRKKWLFGAVGFLSAVLVGIFGMPEKAEAAVADGTYSIDGYLKSATADKSSMGDAALVKPMKLIAKDGSYTIQADLVPLTTNLGTASFTGYLSEFYYYPDYNGGDSGYAMPDGEVGQAAGVTAYYEGIYDSYNDATTGTDSSVKGKWYPKTLSFPIAENDSELWVQVYVPVMESISTGGGRQYAKLELDWNSITKISDETTGGSTDNSSDTDDTKQTVDKKGLYHMLMTASNLSAKTNLYTADSITALKKAMKTAQKVYENDDATAAQVDAQISALSAAIMALEEKSSGTLDIKTLSDGTYYLYGKMQKTDKKNLSMSNEAINHTITLTVKNGTYTVTMDFKGLTVNSKKGYLSKLKYYTNSYTTDSYGVPKGTTKNVTVKSVQKSGGKTFSDTYGTNYPAKVTFPLIGKAKSTGYVPLQVFVPIMDAISKGSGTQAVYLKLDLNSITADKSNVAETETDTTTTTTTGTTTGTTTTTQTTGTSTLKAGSSLPTGTTGTTNTTGTTTTTGTTQTSGTAKSTTTSQASGTAKSATTSQTSGTAKSAIAGQTAGTATGGIAAGNTAGMASSGEEDLDLESSLDDMSTGEPLVSALDTGIDNDGEEDLWMDDTEELYEDDTEDAWEEEDDDTSLPTAVLPSIMSTIVAGAGIFYKIRSRM